jgi:Ala-tRNA(Pro) deacylase
MIAARPGFATSASPHLPRSTLDSILTPMAEAPLTPEDLFRRLEALGIAYRTYHHPPVFTVAEAAALRGSLPGGHCKSLFLKDKKGSLWLAVMLEQRRIDLNKLAARLGARRFSFGGAEELHRRLGVQPGSVTPFALVNDTGHRVTPVLDQEMLGYDPLNYHPLANDRTTAIAPDDLLRFIAACGHRPLIVDLSALDRGPVG